MVKVCFYQHINFFLTISLCNLEFQSENHFCSALSLFSKFVTKNLLSQKFLYSKKSFNYAFIFKAFYEEYIILKLKMSFTQYT